jgi:hypothetical protein
MNSVDQWPHVRRGTRARDKNEIPPESFTSKARRLEQIARPGDNALGRKEHNVQWHQ